MSDPQRHQKRREGAAISERRMIVEEVEEAGVVGCDQPLQEQSPEQTREHTHQQEEARPAGDPALAVERDAAARHDHMHVRVMVSAEPRV